MEPKQEQPPAYTPPPAESSDSLPLTSSLDDDDELNLADLEIEVSGPGADTRAHMGADGTVDMWLDLKKPLPKMPAPPQRQVTAAPEASGECPPLNIVIFVVGSRGDVQPYLALALRLIMTNRHRVRIATHTTFKDLVLGGNELLPADLAGQLEFFDVGGDPKELMAFMVKNPGLMPGFDSLTNGDVSSKRRMAGEMLQGFYQSCFEADSGTGTPFAADAIISNPPAFAGLHVAESLGLPLLMSFTMPWSPTNLFPHPLVNIQASNAGKGLTNYLSYALADTLIWQGLGDIMNKFRHQLGLAPLSALTGPMALERLATPCLYAWSPSLLPKPDEWREHIDIAGFFTLPSTVSYTPNPELAAFLAAGEPPVYIGFGSIVVANPDALTALILSAVEIQGCRALISAGWSDLGGLELPKNVYLIKGDIPHDWLFEAGRVSAVVHHGGAGTTSAGLRAGLPTVIIPFFGDQKFWGTAVALARAGPDPIPFKKLTADKLVHALGFALSEPAREAASAIGAAIRAEDGTLAGVNAFHRHLPLDTMRCDVDPSATARWWCKKHCMRLSSSVAGVLVERKILEWRDLAPLRTREHYPGKTYTDPITAGSQAMLGVMTTGMVGAAQLFTKKPHRGVTKLTWGMVKGGADIFGVMYEGFDNLPGMMGTRVRTRSRVDSFGNGVLEGGKSLTYGFMDGISGMVTEPYDGYKKNGALGALGGFGTSLPNLFFRPLTGCFGFFVHPTVGAFRSIQAWRRGGGPLAHARMTASGLATKGLSGDQGAQIAVAFRREIEPRKVKARKSAERVRRKEAETGYDWSALSAEEKAAIVGNQWWWEERLLPPRRSEPSSPIAGSSRSRDSEPSSPSSSAPPPLPPRRTPSKH